MTFHIKTKGIPKGFSYPITRKELRELLKNLDVQFTSVHMESISMSESFKTKDLSLMTSRHLGILEADREIDGLTFQLEVNALRDEDHLPWHDSVVNLLYEQITKWIRKKQVQPDTAPIEPAQLFLGFDIKKDKFIDKCHEVRKR